MIKKHYKNRAWFLCDDGRVPQALYIMYDYEKCGSMVRFLQGNNLDLAEIGTLIFNVTDNKWAKPECILKWDFLPNSIGITLANERALKLLEEIAPDQFQAISTEIRMPDGFIIRNYKLINITNSISAIDYSKCTLKEEKFRTKANQYKDYWYKKDCLGDDCQLAVERDRGTIFIGSEKLRQAIKHAKLIGLQFKNTYGTSHCFIEE